MEPSIRAYHMIQVKMVDGPHLKGSPAGARPGSLCHYRRPSCPRRANDRRVLTVVVEQYDGYPHAQYQVVHVEDIGH
eukprot:m.55123 g.55123  ORF g.55123 m.55123 type:complete len:77 (-) comp16860_c0_seq1:799-1029(-)